jgi:DNA modification methylase
MPVLQFKGKTAIECYHYTVPHHVLDFDAKLSVLPKGERPNLDGNLIIEGDNLLALKALVPTHAGRIKCIYIDPPYNTGDEGWVFNDNLSQPQFKEWIGQTVGKEGEDACRHDKWCCMMYPRLMLLKELLREDGIILVSIDDTEFHNLRILTDEIFDSRNWISTLIWKRRQTPDSRNLNGVSADHEFVLCYGRTDQIRFKGQEKDLSKYSNPDNDPLGPWMSDNLTGLANAEERPNLHYEIVNSETGKKYPPHPSRGWIYGREKMAELVRAGRILWPNSPKGRPRLKRYISDMKTETTGFSTILDAPANVVGTKELNSILGQKAFSFPKPSGFVRSLIDQVTDESSLILDSFAGTGTTGQAVLELNQQDDGQRRFILVQMPYDNRDNERQKFNICKNITAERIRRVIDGYMCTNPTGKKEKVEGLGGSFTYARVGRRLFGEYRDLGDKLPAYEELAKYIFYTEASYDFDAKAVDKKTGRIGEHSRTAYYLLYSADAKSERALDMAWLKEVGEKEKCRSLVVYCEKLWAHRDELNAWEKQTGRKLRTMIVPFQLK